MYIQTHSAIGASAVVLIIHPPLTSLIPCILFSTMGSIIVDIDHQYIANKFIFPILAVIFTLCYYLDLLTFSKSFILGLSIFFITIITFYSSGHRNIAHSFLGLILGSIPIYFMNKTVISAFALGYCFHLVADSFTRTGVKFFFPFDKTSYGLKIINMHTTKDFPFFIASLFILTLIVIYKYNLSYLLSYFINILNTFFFNFL